MMKQLKWVLKFEQSEHVVILNRGVNIRDPMSLTLDGEVIAQLAIPQSSILAKLEYSFTCEGEQVLLVLFGNKADLVFRGAFQSNQKKYQPNHRVPLWAVAIVVALNILASVLVGKNLMSWFMAIASSVLALFYSMIPFYSKPGKWIRMLLFLLLNWSVAFSSAYLNF
ncbi:MAG: hypothetical protein IJX19_07290 [Clostridia bacterium]|nr:hypothetical protein [Clostridia bacterium]